MPQTTYPPEEVVRRGEEIYERRIRADVDTPENRGKVIVVDIETGDYDIDEDGLAAARRLRARHPGAALFATRIGFSALTRLGFPTSGLRGRFSPSKP